MSQREPAAPTTKGEKLKEAAGAARRQEAGGRYKNTMGACMRPSPIEWVPINLAYSSRLVRAAPAGRCRSIQCETKRSLQ